jgi:putative transposase
VTQQARQVTWGLGEREEPVRFLIRDRDRKFTSRFDAVFEAQAVRVVRTPVQAPEANGIAERLVRTVRSECLDWLLILNARHLERTVKVFIDHYNSRRPHRSLGLVRRMIARQSSPERSVNRSVCDGVTGYAPFRVVAADKSIVMAFSR